MQICWLRQTQPNKNGVPIFIGSGVMNERTQASDRFLPLVPLHKLLDYIRKTRNALARTAASWHCQFGIMSWHWPTNDLDPIDPMITWDYKWNEIALHGINSKNIKNWLWASVAFIFRLGKYWVMTLTCWVICSTMLSIYHW